MPRFSSRLGLACFPPVKFCLRAAFAQSSRQETIVLLSNGICAPQHNRTMDRLSWLSLGALQGDNRWPKSSTGLNRPKASCGIFKGIREDVGKYKTRFPLRNQTNCGGAALPSRVGDHRRRWDCHFLPSAQARPGRDGASQGVIDQTNFGLSFGPRVFPSHPQLLCYAQYIAHEEFLVSSCLRPLHIRRAWIGISQPFAR